jgi:aldehyde dehydrogenase (NAD+)
MEKEIVSVHMKGENLIKHSFQRLKTKSLQLRLQSVKERKKLLKEFLEFILTNRERIANAIHQDFKKPFGEIDLSEIYPVVSEIRYAIDHLDEWTDIKKVNAPINYIGTRSEIQIEPKGVCLIIAPWNFPFNLCFGPLVSCLAAGNTAIIKPSEMTPNTSALIAALVSEFFDEDIVKVIEGGAEVSTELLTYPFDHIFFTGSPAIGKIVMRAASEHLTSVTLELGGKSPTIIDEKAELKSAANRIAFGKFLNNGQTCIAPDYILVHEKVKDKFIELLKAEVVRLFGANGKVDESVQSYARIVNERHFTRLNQLLEDAILHGAKIELGGDVNSKTNFIHPMILSKVSPQARIMQEEIFGPLLPVLSYSTESEMVTMINSRPKPLALYIFSGNKHFQKDILSKISAGSACINDCVIQFTHPNLPFGGVNNSGIGKSHGYAGFLEFSNQKPVLKQLTRFSAISLLYPPYTAKMKNLINMMLKYF